MITRFLRRYFFSPGTEINWYSTIAVIYFTSHLYGLLKLPVFADESIYIRWAQLIMDEPARYAFFALNDGKTPLFIWLLVPFQYLFSDQLFSARLVAVLVGFIQVLLTGAVIRKLQGSKVAEMVGMLAVCFLPFWFFHHRMALMDGLLCVWITAAFYYTLIVQEYLATQSTQYSASEASIARTLKAVVWSRLTWVIIAGSITIGAAIWTKVPAVLALPSLYLWIFWHPKKSIVTLINRSIPLAAMTFGGLCVFALLWLHPAFGQLFARGSDFLYPLSEVLKGAWITSLQQIPNYLRYFIAYLSPGFLLLLVFGVCIPNKNRGTILLLTLSGLVFMAPITLMGKVVYARYFLPAAIFFTLATISTFDMFVQQLAVPGITANLKERTQKLQAKIILGITGILVVYTVLINLSASYFNPSVTPFVPSDRVQYLTDWASGHGITETVALIQNEAKTKRIAVATEGYFGTLPDALLLYFHRKPVDSIWIEGIGQPVNAIPKSFVKRAKDYDEVWLVVNSHRMKLKLPSNTLKAEFCRPDAAPCLQIWDITKQLDELPSN